MAETSRATPESIASTQFFFEDYTEGQHWRSRGRTVTDADNRAYLGATGTAHPNHTDNEYAKRHTLLREVCAPGVLVLGIVDGVIADEVTRHMASSMNYGHEKVRYLHPVYLGDTITADITVTKTRIRGNDWGVVEIESIAHNQDGDPVLFDCHLLIVKRRGAERNPA